MLEEFELNEDQLRWHRHRDWGHQMTRERAAEIANDKWLPPGLISIDWIALLPPVARWRESGHPGAKSKSALGVKRGALFAVLSIDPTTSVISSVRRVWTLRCCGTTLTRGGTTSTAEQEVREKQFRAVYLEVGGLGGAPKARERGQTPQGVRKQPVQRRGQLALLNTIL